MSVPAFAALESFAGSDFSYTVVWRDENGVLVDVTGYSAKMSIRKRYDDAKSLIDLTDSNARIVMGGVSGYVQLKLRSCCAEAS